MKRHKKLTLGTAVIIVGLICAVRTWVQAEEEAKTIPMPLEAHADHIMVNPKDLTWIDGPASLPAGAKMAVIEGDPKESGPFTMRGMLPANYKIPPHWHPADEHVTVLEGTLYMGLGEEFDEAKATALPIGGFAVMKTGTRHYAFTKDTGVTVQIHGQGPWGITYVNPADDPTNEK